MQEENGARFNLVPGHCSDMGGEVWEAAREAFVVIICNSNITSWTPETIASLDAHGETLFHHPWLICVPRVLFYNSPP